MTIPVSRLCCSGLPCRRRGHPGDEITQIAALGISDRFRESCDRHRQQPLRRCLCIRISGVATAFGIGGEEFCADFRSNLIRTREFEQQARAHKIDSGFAATRVEPVNDHWTAPGHDDVDRMEITVTHGAAFRQAGQLLKRGLLYAVGYAGRMADFDREPRPDRRQCCAIAAVNRALQLEKNLRKPFNRVRLLKQKLEQGGAVATLEYDAVPVFDGHDLFRARRRYAACMCDTGELKFHVYNISRQPRTEQFDYVCVTPCKNLGIAAFGESRQCL